MGGGFGACGGFRGLCRCHAGQFCEIRLRGSPIRFATQIATHLLWDVTSALQMCGNFHCKSDRRSPQTYLSSKSPRDEIKGRIPISEASDMRILLCVLAMAVPIAGIAAPVAAPAARAPTPALRPLPKSPLLFQVLHPRAILNRRVGGTRVRRAERGGAWRGVCSRNEREFLTCRRCALHR